MVSPMLGDSSAQPPGPVRDHVQPGSSARSGPGVDGDRPFEEGPSSPIEACGSGRCPAPRRAGRVPAVARDRGRPSARRGRRRTDRFQAASSARTSTSMSRGGPVSRPSHENSVEKCSTASWAETRAGSGRGASACAGRRRESREEIRCRGWRADRARWPRGCRAAPDESAARRCRHEPSGRDPRGAARGRLASTRQPGRGSRQAGLRDRARGRDDFRSPARVARRRLRSRAGPSG